MGDEMVPATDDLRRAYAVAREVAEVAHDCGYAVALHGSCDRDIDLVAVPWAESVFDRSALIRELEERLGLWANPGSSSFPGVVKPHGRVGCILWGRGKPIDLSIAMPNPFSVIADTEA